ncbi:MAG: serine/threonine-protein kinase, partial [Kofleriaceae bacterium]
AHERGIIHRDLKPDNLFVVADPAVPGGERIKILDFGIAKLLDRRADDGHHSTVTGAIMGTPAYMSPEQCRGAGAIDHRTDIYALGCVLFQLLTGRPPFVAPTPGDMIASQLRQDPPAPSTLVPGIAPELDALVLTCLAKDPDARFATMTELVRAGGAITGDNHALLTIPPLRSSGELESDPTEITGASLPGAILPRSLRASSAGVMAVHPPVTTLSAGSLSTDSTPPRHRPRSLLFILGAALVAGIVAVSFALVHDPAARTPAGTAPTGDAGRTIGSLLPPPLDAGALDAALADAPAAAPPRDAGVRPRPRRVDAGPDVEPGRDYR